MEVTDCQDADARKTYRQMSYPQPLYNWKVFDADPDEKDETCSYDEIWVWIPRKIEFKMIFLEVSDYQDTDPREKNNDILVEYSSTSAVFSIEILMEEIELVVAQN